MRNAAIVVLSSVIAALLAFSSFTHLENGFRFLHSVLSYRLVNPDMGLAIASLAPFVQLLLALILLFDRRGRPGAFAVCALIFLGYSLSQLTAHFRGLNIACGCFGGNDESPIGVTSIGLVLGCMSASLVGLWLTRNTLKGAP